MKPVLNLLLLILFITVAQACNYNYYRGTELEKEGRFEEANIEYHRAYTRNPDDDDFKEAFERTSTETAADLFKRYKIYLEEKKYTLAFRRLEQARTLAPHDENINKELKKWVRILIAGRIDFLFQSLRNQIPLSDEMVLQVQFNTPNSNNSNRLLTAAIDNQTRVFSIEDVLYEPPPNILMFYTISSIGVRLASGSRFGSSAFAEAMVASPSGLNSFKKLKKFIDFRTPALIKVEGQLSTDKTERLGVEQYYPVEMMAEQNGDLFNFPINDIRFSLNLDGDAIKVKSSAGYIAFLPQILYMNRKSQRIFLDFGHLEVQQKQKSGLWSFRRVVSEDRTYLEDLKKSVLLEPYFYFREGRFSFKQVDGS